MSDDDYVVRERIVEACDVCDAFARLDCELPEGHSLFDECRCEGSRRFVWYGTIPQDESEAEKLVALLRETFFDLVKKRGPKKKIGPDEVFQAMDKSPDATLSEIAGSFPSKVSERTVQRILEPFGGFQKCQEAIRSKAQSGQGRRLKKKFNKLLPRRLKKKKMTN